jgi:hypothetical protein
MITDLGNHATTRLVQVMSDTVVLFDTQTDAYTMAASVAGGMVCWLAKLRPGDEPHATKLALVMRDLAECVKKHHDHGDE